jgi:hypothetical protein
MEPSPYWEADSHLSSQIIPLLWDPKVRYLIEKSTQPVPVLSQMNPVHTLLPHLFKISFNIILPPTPGSSEWSLSFRLKNLSEIKEKSE